MTPAEIKKTRLYRTLAPCVRKEDREELARMLGIASDAPAKFNDQADRLLIAFVWSLTPQNASYWRELSLRLREAGHECW